MIFFFLLLLVVYGIKKKMQVTAQKFVNFIEVGDSSVLSSFLAPAPAGFEK